MTKITRIVSLALGLLLSSLAAAKVHVVTTLPDYAWAARQVGGDLVEAEFICPPEQDAHFLAPRPSYALRLARADLFVSTGLDLELWAPVLLQKASNGKIMPGQPGYVSAAQGVTLRDKPASADRSQGDVHIFGNPHIHTSPINMRQILKNIAAGLQRVDAAHHKDYAHHLQAALLDLDQRTFGPELVRLVGGETLARLSDRGKLMAFLQAKKYQGTPLAARLGGWIGALAPFRGRSIVTYHPNWAYLVHTFGLHVAASIELKPGIPPSPAHVRDVLQLIERQKIPLLFTASFFPREQVELVASRAGVPAAIVPFNSGGRRAKNYPALVDLWVEALKSKLAAHQRSTQP